MTGCTLTLQAPLAQQVPTHIDLEDVASTEEAQVPADDHSVPVDDAVVDVTLTGNNTTQNNPLPVQNYPAPNIPAPVVNCYVRSDWLSYLVVAGDTISNLAQRTNSSISALSQGNCLSNPNAISVGQLLRVPQIPAPRITPTPKFVVGQQIQVTPAGHDLRVRSQPGTGFAVVGQLVQGLCVTVTSGPAQANGYTWWRIAGPRGLNGWAAEGSISEVWLSAQYTECAPINPGPIPDPIVTFNCLDPRWKVVGSNFVSISPSLSFNNGCYQIATGATVTISWPGAPTSQLSQVTFYRRSDNSTRADVIGVDNYPADGISIQYTVPGGLPPSAIYAQTNAIGTPGAPVSSNYIGFYTSEAYPVCPAWVIPGGNAPEVSPHNGFDGRCYQLSSGMTVTISWPGAPAGATEVTFYRNNPILTKADVLGTDSDPSDGFSIQVPVSSWAASDLFARSINGDQQGSEQESGHVGVFVTN